MCVIVSVGMRLIVTMRMTVIVAVRMSRLMLVRVVMQVTVTRSYMFVFVIVAVRR